MIVNEDRSCQKVIILVAHMSFMWGTVIIYWIYWDRAFDIMGPKLWNSPPVST